MARAAGAWESRDAGTGSAGGGEACKQPGSNTRRRLPSVHIAGVFANRLGIFTRDVRNPELFFWCPIGQACPKEAQCSRCAHPPWKPGPADDSAMENFSTVLMQRHCRYHAPVDSHVLIFAAKLLVVTVFGSGIRCIGFRQTLFVTQHDGRTVEQASYILQPSTPGTRSPSARADGLLSASLSCFCSRQVIQLTRCCSLA